MSRQSLVHVVLASALALAACSKSSRTIDPSKLTKADFDEISKLVIDAYPAPFDDTFKKVVDKIGKPGKTSDNMYEWYTHDGGPCWELAVTKGNDKGAAAVSSFQLEGAQANACQ